MSIAKLTLAPALGALGQAGDGGDQDRAELPSGPGGIWTKVRQRASKSSCVPFSVADRALDIVAQRSEQTAFLFTDVQTPGPIDGIDLARLVKTRANRA